jgi:hypothetical protein
LCSRLTDDRSAENLSDAWSNRLYAAAVGLAAAAAIAYFAWPMPTRSTAARIVPRVTVNRGALELEGSF